MRTGRLLIVGSMAVMALVLAACGESREVTLYKQGVYQGKRDDPPWANPRFNGNKLAWEKAIKARTNGQNEYAHQAAE